MFKNILIIFFVSLLTIGTLIASETTRPVLLPDIRTEAMGGSGIMNATGALAFNYNPAILAREEYNFTLADVQISMSDDFADFYAYLDDNKDKFGMLDKEKYPDLTPQQTDEIINDLRLEAAKLDNIWARGRLVPSMGLNIKNIGIGFYNIASVALKSDVGIVVPKVFLKVYNDFVFTAGYGKQIWPNFSLGANLKIIRRNEAPLYKIQVEEVNSLEDTWEAGKEEFSSAKSGFGIDLGGIYHFDKNLQFGAVLQDFIGRIDGISTPLNMKVGMHYLISEQLTLAGSIQDFFNVQGDHFFKKMHIGGEYSIPIFRFRAGISQGYLTGGLGIDFKVLKINYTYFQREIASAPGQDTEGLHMLGLQLVAF